VPGPRLSRLLFVAWLLLLAALASAQTEITDATVDDLLRRAEEAFRQGRAAEAAYTVERVAAWAQHIRDVAPGSRNPAEEYAFAERISLRVLATIGRTLGPDHESAFNALLGLATHYIEQRREAEADPLLARAMRVAERAPAPSEDHRRAAIARVLGQQGLLEEGRGRQGDAEVCYRQALDIVLALPPRLRGGAGPAVRNFLRFLRATNREHEASAIEGRFGR
jgi:hypothetical protein